MPILRIKEIRDMSSDDRTKKLGEFRTELLRLKTMIGAGGTVENPARVKALRKAIAKVLTIENEGRHGVGKAEPKKAEPKKAEPKKAERKKTELGKRKKR